MSKENFELHRQSIEAVNRGDIDDALRFLDPDIVFEPLRAPVQGAYRGHAGVREWWADTAETFESFRIDHTDVRELGDDRLLAIGTLHVRGRGSGIETDVPTAAIVSFRDGRMVSVKDYGDRDTALEAAGLRE
jgi:ketosteroid isomerase-like protein